MLESLKDGVTIEGIHYAGIEATLDRVQGTNIWLTLGLREGKNREVKRVLAHLGLATTRLIRISYGPFQLGDLADGEVREVRGRVLRDQLGAKLADAAHADFEAPIRPLAPLPPPLRPQRKPAPGKPTKKKPARTRSAKSPGKPTSKPTRKPTSKPGRRPERDGRADRRR